MQVALYPYFSSIVEMPGHKSSWNTCFTDLL